MGAGYEDDVAFKLSLVDDPGNQARLDKLASSVEMTAKRISDSLSSAMSGAISGAASRGDSESGRAGAVADRMGAGKVSVKLDRASMDELVTSLKSSMQTVGASGSAAMTSVVGSAVSKVESQVKAAMKGMKDTIEKEAKTIPPVSLVGDTTTAKKNAEVAGKQIAQAQFKAHEAEMGRLVRAGNRVSFVDPKDQAAVANKLAGGTIRYSTSAARPNKLNRETQDIIREYYTDANRDRLEKGLAPVGKPSGISQEEFEQFQENQNVFGRTTTGKNRLKKAEEQGRAEERARYFATMSEDERLNRGLALARDPSSATASELEGMFGKNETLARQAGWIRDDKGIWSVRPSTESPNLRGSKSIAEFSGSAKKSVAVESTADLTALTEEEQKAKVLRDAFAGMGSGAKEAGEARTKDLVDKNGFVEFAKDVAAKVFRDQNPGWKEERVDGKYRFTPGSGSESASSAATVAVSDKRKKLADLQAEFDNADLSSGFSSNPIIGSAGAQDPQKVEALKSALDELEESGTKSAESIAAIDKELEKIKPTSLGELSKASGKAVHSMATLGKGIAQIYIATGAKGGDELIKTIVKIEGFANTAVGLAKSVDTVSKAGTRFINFFVSSAEKAKLSQERLKAVAEATQTHADGLRKVYEAAKAAGESQERLNELLAQSKLANEAAAESAERLADAESKTGPHRRRGVLNSIAATAGGLVRDQVGGNAVFDKIGDKLGDSLESLINKKGGMARKLLKKTKLGRRALGGVSKARNLIRTAGKAGARGAAARATLGRFAMRAGPAAAALAAAGGAAWNVGDSLINGKPLSQGAPAGWLGGKIFDAAKWSGQGKSLALGEDIASLVKKDESLTNENFIKAAYAQQNMKVDVARRKAAFTQSDMEFSSRQRLSAVDELEIGDTYGRQVSQSRSEADRIRAEQRRIRERQQSGAISKSEAARLQAQLGSQLSTATASQTAGVAGIVAQQERDLSRQQDSTKYLRGQLKESYDATNSSAESEKGMQEQERRVDLQKKIEESLRGQIQTIREIQATQRAANDEQIANLRTQQEEWKRTKEAAIDAARGANDRLADKLMNSEGDFDRYVDIKKKVAKGEKLDDDEAKYLSKNAIDKQDKEYVDRFKRNKLDERLKSEGLSGIVGTQERAEAADAAIRERNASSGIQNLEQRNRLIDSNANAQVGDLSGQLRENLKQQAENEKILIQAQVEVQVKLFNKEVEAAIKKAFSEMNLNEKQMKEIERIAARAANEQGARGAQAGRNA